MELIKQPKEPWVLRVCPERYKRNVTFVGSLIGVLGYIVYLFGGFFAILFGPILFAKSEPDAPISRPVIWLAEAWDGFHIRLSRNNGCDCVRLIVGHSDL